MPWVQFIRDFPWTPPSERRVTVDYKAGKTYFIPREASAAAYAAEAAKPTKRPGRTSEPVEPSE